MEHKIEITGNKITKRIIFEVLSGIFKYKDYKMGGYDDVPFIRIENHPKFILSNKGFNQNDFFLIDENRDKIFTKGLLEQVEKYI